jgi:protein-S-isoprenylcysteine O-methyltransferase Ste14
MHLKIPPVLLTGFVVVMMFVTSYLLPQFSYSLANRIPVAIIVAVFGVAIAGAGVIAFRRLQTTVNPTKPDTASNLAIEGIYRRTRNPMYLGILLFLLACSIFLGNFLVLVVYPAAFVLYINKFQIKPEEDALLLIFGDEYKSYLDRVRRWL